MKRQWQKLKQQINQFFISPCTDCGFFVACIPCSERYDKVDQQLEDETE